MISNTHIKQVFGASQIDSPSTTASLLVSEVQTDPVNPVSRRTGLKQPYSHIIPIGTVSRL